MLHAVTKQSVLDAFKPRVRSMARWSSRIWPPRPDYLVGSPCSRPVAQRPVRARRAASSGGTAARRRREAEIEAFKKTTNTGPRGHVATGQGEEFHAALGSAGKKLEKLDIKDEASATAIKAASRRAISRFASRRER